MTNNKIQMSNEKPKLIEPFLMVLIGVIVGLVVITVILPLAKVLM